MPLRMSFNELQRFLDMVKYLFISNFAENITPLRKLQKKMLYLNYKSLN